MKREAIGKLGYFSLDGGEFVFPLTQAIQILKSEVVRIEFGELGENTARALEVWARTEVNTIIGVDNGKTT